VSEKTVQMIRKYGVWIGLAITLILVYVVESEEQEMENFSTESVEIATPKVRNTKITTVEASSRFQLRRVQLRQEITDEPINLFPAFFGGNEDIAQEEASIVAEVVTSPYIYAGKLIEDGAMVVFLTDGNKKYAVKAGDTIEGAWKVKFIQSPEMALQYLPSNTQVSVQIGELL